MKGSLTVEAAYIFPFCFMVIGLVSILGLFLFNQAVLEMTAYECILHTIEERTLDEESFKDNLLKRAEQVGNERTFGVKELQVSMKMTASKISLTYTGTQSVIGVPIEATAVYERTFPELTLKLKKGMAGLPYEGIFEKRPE